MHQHALEALLLLRLWMDSKKKRARDVYKVLTGDGTMTSDAIQGGIHRLGLPCDWCMAKGLFTILSKLRKKKEDFVTLVEFDEALRMSVAEMEKVVGVTDTFSHGEDKRKKFDLRVWLAHGKNRLRTAELISHIYLNENPSEEVELKAIKGCSKSDSEVILLLELAELPCDPLTFASMRVVLRHVTVLARIETQKKTSTSTTTSSITSMLETQHPVSVTAIANQLNEAVELVYGNYLGPGMDNVLAELNKKMAFLTKSLREESEQRLALDVKSNHLEKELSMCKVRLDDSMAMNAEYGALLKLVRLRKNIARKETKKTEGTSYDIDIEGSLLVNNHTKRELQKAKHEAEWWRMVNKVSALRYKKIYMRDDKYKSAALCQKYRLMFKRSQRRLWRLAATGSWLQQEFNELSSVVERHIKRKLNISERPGGVTFPSTQHTTQTTPPKDDDMVSFHEGTEEGGEGGHSKSVQVTPQSIMATKKKANLNIAALQSLENEDDALLIQQLGSQIEKMNYQAEHERERSSQVVDDKDNVTLALRRRIAALEDTIVRESSSTYSSKLNRIRQQPFYTKDRSIHRMGASRSGNAQYTRGSDLFKTPQTRNGGGNIYERMRAFEDRLVTTSASTTRNLDVEFRRLMNDGYTPATAPPTRTLADSNQYGIDRPQNTTRMMESYPSAYLGSTRQRSNSAFYQSEIYDLTKALEKANINIVKKSNAIDKLNLKQQNTQDELNHVKEYIGKAHANEAVYRNKIKELKHESRSARDENAQMKKVLHFKNAYSQLRMT